MTNGPPSSTAGPSSIPNTVPVTHRYLHTNGSNVTSQQPYYASVTEGVSAPASSANRTFYPANSTWQNNSWTPSPTLQAKPQAPQYNQSPYPQAYQSTARYNPGPLANTVAQPAVVSKARTPSPSPPPPPEFKHWDAVIYTFMKRVGLSQALSGFESDMLVMNPEWEKKTVPGALSDLMKGILLLSQDADEQKAVVSINDQERSLDERKLHYIHSASQPFSQTSVNKAISSFLAQNRARSDSSNRAEFLLSLADKRRRLNDDQDSHEIPSCARADAKPLDRDVQMKYDIAKNDDGPLRRTTRNQSRSSISGAAVSVAAASTSKAKGKQSAKDPKKVDKIKIEGGKEEDSLSSARHLGLDQRLTSIETHLSVRYVPSIPQNLLVRLQFLEDHITRLEKDYPPWAALHFNQPNRGWPPPPRSTPVIVPPHLRGATQDASVQKPFVPIPAAMTGGVKTRNTATSLHRAVLERLEVQQAMSDLTGNQ